MPQGKGTGENVGAKPVSFSNVKQTRLSLGKLRGDDIQLNSEDGPPSVALSSNGSPKEMAMWRVGPGWVVVFACAIVLDGCTSSPLAISARHMPFFLEQPHSSQILATASTADGLEHINRRNRG